jgi:hypothetical protein
MLPFLLAKGGMSVAIALPATIKKAARQAAFNIH